MKCFIWKDLDVVSDRYHSNGGFVAIAESLEKARKMRVIVRADSFNTIPGNPYYREPDPWKYFDIGDELKKSALIEIVKDVPNPYPDRNPGWVTRTFRITLPITEEPDIVLEVANGTTEEAIAFPNAGCC